MNLLKRFIRGTDPIDDPVDEIEENEYYEDEQEFEDPDVAKGLAAIDSDDRKNPTIRPAATEKVSLKIMVAHSNADAVPIADLLKEGSIVLLDISNLEKDQAFRLIDFLAGVAYVIGGEMTKTARNTIIISPAGVDIAGVIPDFGGEEEEAEAEADED